MKKSLLSGRRIDQRIDDSRLVHINAIIGAHSMFRIDYCIW